MPICANKVKGLKKIAEFIKEQKRRKKIAKMAVACAKAETMAIIQSAAIKINDIIEIGRDHAGILDRLGYPPLELYEEGFVTDKGKFVSRREAAKIAFLSGQTTEDKGVLYSYHI